MPTWWSSVYLHVVRHSSNKLHRFVYWTAINTTCPTCGLCAVSFGKYCPMKHEWPGMNLRNKKVLFKWASLLSSQELHCGFHWQASPCTSLNLLYELVWNNTLMRMSTAVNKPKLKPHRRACPNRNDKVYTCLTLCMENAISYFQRSNK